MTSHPAKRACLSFREYFKKYKSIHFGLTSPQNLVCLYLFENISTDRHALVLKSVCLVHINCRRLAAKKRFQDDRQKSLVYIRVFHFEQKI